MSAFEDGVRRLCLIAVADETERRQLWRQLARQDRLRAVGETAAGVAHNFNNLLTVILGNAHLCARRAVDDETRRLLDSIVKAASDGAQMTARVMDFARDGDTATRTRTDLNNLARDALDFAAPYRQTFPELVVRAELDASLPRVELNPGEIREVIVNLLNNAADAMDGSGRLLVATARDRERAVLSVTDSGRGIPAEIRDRIFLPFFTTKGEHGTGLGLALSYAIVRRHNGDLEVDSEPGRGTTMRFWLPLGDGLARA